MNPNPVLETTVSTLMLSAFVAVALAVAGAAWMLLVVILHVAISASGVLFGMTCT